MEAPEVHILIQQSWQLFGTFTFKDDVMSTARRFNMFFAWLRQSAKQFRVYFPRSSVVLADGTMIGVNDNAI
jgi:hypothetical protein